MKLVRSFIVAAVALAAVPAAADNGQRFDWKAQLQAFSTERGDPPNNGQCFNGKFISGANRSKAGTLYVQPRTGGVYEVRMAGDCSALNAAEKISLRSNGSDAVCDHSPAEVVLRTAVGPQRCRATEVRRLTNREVVALAQVAHR
jgi:hypothetical protein